jgi:beta-lactamase regulating signal transducer with metallopeptidase domain
MTGWMLWAIAIGALLAAAAHVTESTLRAFGRPGRWAWVAATLGALVIQGWSIVPWSRQATASERSSPADGEAAASVALLKVEEAGAAVGAYLEQFDTSVLIGWVSVSTVLLIGLVGGLLRLHRRAAAWRVHTIDGAEVLVSDDFGPALLGIRAPRIVLPEHVMAMEPRVIRVICAHEAEHRAAHDTWLLAAGALLASVMPWNLALWWKVMRLRQAIEIDCDERVLSSGVSRRDYGAILLDLAADMDHVAPPVPAFAQPTSLLERRITTMIIGSRKKGLVATATSTIGVVLLGIAACQTPAPTPPETVEMPSRVFAALGSDPLIFVDGERVEGPPRDILESYSRDDIESIEIIKGPYAMTLYGDEAVNGVIVIVLK